MRLDEYTMNVYLPERPGLSNGYCKLMLATVRRLSTFAGRDLQLTEVNRPLLAAWARSLLASHRPASVNDSLRMIRTLLLAAYDDGRLDRPPRRVRRLPESLPPPAAWTVHEVRRLLAHLSTMPGRVGERPASDWWTALILTVYWTGCRISALLQATAADYQSGKGLLVRHQKNGRSQWYPLPLSCCKAIERMLPDSGPIWPWPYHRTWLWVRFRRCVEAAGLPCPRTYGQLFHRLRRTTASYLAAEDIGLAQRQMDHSSAELTRRSYVDPRIAVQRSAADVLPDPMPS